MIKGNVTSEHTLPAISFKHFVSTGLVTITKGLNVLLWEFTEVPVYAISYVKRLRPALEWICYKSCHFVCSWKRHTSLNILVTKSTSHPYTQVRYNAESCKYIFSCGFGGISVCLSSSDTIKPCPTKVRHTEQVLFVQK